MSKAYNLVKHYMSVFLTLALILSVLPTAARAATEDPNLSNELTVTVGVKKYNTDGEVVDQFFIFPYRDGGIYTFSVSDESVVMASIVDCPLAELAKNFKAIKLVGLKLGTSVVTVNEAYGGKTTAIAKTTVTVEDTYLTTINNEKHEYGLGKYQSGLLIVNQKIGAEYTFTVDKEGLVVSMSSDDIECSSTKVGNYKLTVIENYNGVSKVLGTVDMHVLPVTWKSEYTMSVGDIANLTIDKVVTNWDNRYRIAVESDGLDINILNRHEMIMTFEAAVAEYNYNNPGSPYPVDKCFVYYDRGSFNARLVGTQVIHVYKVDPQKLEAPALVCDITVTVVAPGTVIPPVTEPPAVPTVAPSPCAATLDGKPVTLNAYLFPEGSGSTNYVMLRDVAYLLNGTAAQFEVGWTAKDGITLTTGQAYTPVGGEMQSKGDGNKPYTLNTSTIAVGGKVVEMVAYSIEGNNYFKLRDLGAALGFGVDWDGASGTVVITTAN